MLVSLKVYLQIEVLVKDLRGTSKKVVVYKLRGWLVS